MSTLQAKLDKFINKLPKKMQFPYLLCKNQEEMLDKLEETHPLAGIYYKTAIQNNKNNNKPLYSREEFLKERPKHQLPKKHSENFYGFSTNPILINSVAGEINHIIFVYLHEAGHLLGFKSKSKKNKLPFGTFSEDMSDDIANFYLKKHWKRKRNFTK